MIVNFWVAISPKLVTSFALAEAGVGEFPPGGKSIQKDTFRMLNRHFPIPAEYSPFKTNQDDYAVWNCYSFRDSDIDLIVKDLNAIMKAYPEDFIVLGAWHFEKGIELGMERKRPVPKFPQPPALLARLIDGELKDGVLIAGQAPRQFSAF